MLPHCVLWWSRNAISWVIIDHFKSLSSVCRPEAWFKVWFIGWIHKVWHLIWFKFCFSVSMYTKANASQFERQILLWNFVLGCLSCLRIHMTNWKKTKCPAHLITIAVAMNAVYEHCHSSLAWNGKQCDALTRLSPFKMVVPYKHIHQIKNWQPGLWIKHWVKLQAFKSDINLR